MEELKIAEMNQRHQAERKLVSIATSLLLATRGRRKEKTEPPSLERKWRTFHGKV